MLAIPALAQSPPAESPGVLDWLGVNSWADIPQLGTWGGSLDLNVDRSGQRTRAADGSEFSASSRLTSYGLSVRNHGFALIDPRLLTGNATVRFALQHVSQTASGVQSGQEGELVGYNFDTTLLAEKPYVTNLFANRTQTLTTQLLGGNTRAENENQGVLFRWREDSFLRDKGILPYFSATVEAREDHAREVTTLADRTFSRDERRSLFGINGHSGQETSDLDFRFEETSLDNLQFPAGSYGSRNANISYSRDFGPGLSRRTDTRLVYGSRSGAAPMSNVDFSERVSIDHRQNLSTSYNYGHAQLTTVAGTATIQTGGAQLQHRLYENLSSYFSLYGMRQDLPSGSLDARGAQTAFNYTHAIPRSGQLTASLAGGEQITDSRLQSSLIPILNASYQAPPALGAGASILLNDTFIVEDSIIVVDVRGGARLATTAGVDYTVLVEGNRTRIVPLPTSLVILPGDPLEVSYLYNFDPSLRFRTSTRSVSLGADWRWIGAMASHEESRQIPLGGSTSTYLTNRSIDSARLELRGSRDYVQARADATASHHDYSNLVYNELRMSQHVSYSARDDLMLGMSADQAQVTYLSIDRRTETRSLRFDLDWATGGWFTTAYLSRRELEDTQMPKDVINEAVVRVNRRWLKLAIAATFGIVERSRGGVDSTNVYFHASAVRDF